VQEADSKHTVKHMKKTS